MHSWRRKKSISDITYLDQEPVMELLTFVLRTKSVACIVTREQKGDISQLKLNENVKQAFLGKF